MRNLIFSLGFITVLLFLHSCTKQGNTLIHFDSTQQGSYTVQMRQPDGTFNTVDTLGISGNDVFEIAFDTLRMISFIPLEGELPVVHAIVGPQTKHLHINRQGYIRGDRENNWLATQRKMQLDLLRFIDSLDVIKETYIDSSTFNGLKALDSAFFTYADVYRGRIVDSIMKAPALLSNLMAIYHRIGNKPVIDYMVDRDALSNMADALDSAYAGSADVAAFRLWVNEFEETYQFTLIVEEAAEKFIPGHPFPELTLETPQGALTNIPKMSLDNQVIAIWASWCAPCRTELKGYTKSNDINNWMFLSLDGLPQQRSPLGEWYEAIVVDELKGTHLSDLGGSRSIIIQSLGLRELPVYFKVIDGIITQRVTSLKELKL